MANSDSPPPRAPSTPPLQSSTKENFTPVECKIEELNESRSDLMVRIQGLKKDLQSWRSKLDSQVKVYRDELSELKQSLNTEVDQLRSEFQELRTTLQPQQDDVTTSLQNSGLQDNPEDCKAEDTEVKGKDDKELIDVKQEVDVKTLLMFIPAGKMII